MRFVLLLLLAAACTGAEQTQAPDGPAMQTDAGDDGGVPFGAPCQTPADPSAECGGGVCFHFGQVTTSPGLCTFHCTMNSQCPSGSMGQKCTTMSVCRP